MKRFFNINFEFDKEQIFKTIDESLKGYICVADGVVISTAARDYSYLTAINGSLFSICDSSWVPVYLRGIYGIRLKQYCGADIFMDIVASRKYRMTFLGTNQKILKGLQENLVKINPDVENMQFVELPFRDVNNFNYPEIANIINKDGAKIIWVALGAPKQEKFMHLLLPYLNTGVMIGVGAVFKFYSGMEENRCPNWMQNNHLEFVYRIIQNPKKQLRRCFWIIRTLPNLLIKEFKQSKKQK